MYRKERDKNTCKTVRVERKIRMRNEGRRGKRVQWKRKRYEILYVLVSSGEKRRKKSGSRTENRRK